MARHGPLLALGVLATALMPTDVLTHLASGSVVVGATLISWHAVRSRQGLSRWWVATTIGVTIGAVLHTGERVLGGYPEPVVRPLELGYLAAYIMLLVGFIGMANDRAPDRRAALSHLFEAVAAVAAFGLIAWHLVIEPALDTGHTDMMAMLGFAIADVVLLVAIGRLALAGTANPAARWLLVCVGILTVGDMAFLAGASSSQAAVGWVASYAAYAMAAAHPRLPELMQRAPAEPAGPRQVWTLVPAIMVVPGAMWISVVSAEPVAWPAASLAVVSAMAVTARLVMLLVDHRAANRELATAADRDALTGLPNRRHLMRTLAASRRVLEQFDLLLFIDLDNFKAVNDVHGHHAGDQVLQVAAQRITRALRSDDLVFRFAGDEFVAACRTLTAGASAELVCTRLLDALSAPIELESATVTVGASIGVTPIDPGRSLEEHLSAADRAMYEIKAERISTRQGEASARSAQEGRKQSR